MASASMIDLPSRLGPSDIGELADWVELNAMSQADGKVAQSQASDVLHDAGWFTGAESDRLPGEADPAEEDLGDDADDRLRSLAIEVWAAMQKRSQVAGESYPFEVSSDVIAVRDGAWAAQPCAAALVLWSNLSRYSPEITVKSVNGITHTELFEELVKASCRGLFRGSTVRFGVPRQADWPPEIESRVKLLGELMKLGVEELSGKIAATDGDRTLDVVSRISFLDDGPGSIILLTQCATGRNWETKRAEPVLTMWQDILRWDSKLVRALAVPWWFGSESEYSKQWRHFDGAVILDRPRLLAGAPDQFLDKGVSANLSAWCAAQFAALPSAN